ncbi:von Willebrand factor type A domain-containing protein [Alkalibaculum bacchi]|uniref:von Willebrand factor type A domain-containing protein n=1 Tax=Alkalibaculum bacchi TaxID=645887 RepID=A0A366IAE1_9FIRM|nr:vWA domain-containing protein [Alkalibaculum bacchi]RBP65994.1 von Willebrand factor type A domain-containing protein [Alkalibaculum bacchi]
MYKLKKVKYYVIFLVIIAVVFSMSSVIAETQVQGNPPTIAVTLVIDNSGSMAETDPQKLRETAAHIFIDQLSPEDYLGIITFNSKEEVILPIQQVKDLENKNEFKKILSSKLEKVRGDTDYLAALDTAGKQLDSIENGNIKKVILFLTDGDPDPDGKGASREYMDSLKESVNSLAMRKYYVYSVGFSNNLNSDVLSEISENTQGKMKISENPEKIALNFGEILAELKNPQGSLKEQIDKSKVAASDLNKNTKESIKSERYAEGTFRSAYIFLGLIGLFVMAALFMILLGWAFYKIYVYKYTIVTGKLLYRRQCGGLSSQNTLNFEHFKKEKIIITFDENKSEAQYRLPNTEYKYDIEIYVDREKSKWKFVDGWKAVLRRGKPSEIILKATKPGIFIYEDKVYSKKKLYSYDKFTSGGYEFEYQAEGKDKKKGKNVLEGIS